MSSQPAEQPQRRERQMARSTFICFLVLAILLSASAVWLAAQSTSPDDSVIRVDVDMVQMNIAVTDKKGNYVTGLDPKSFEIVEDNIPQQVATFEEGNRAPVNLLDRPTPVTAAVSNAPGS